MKGIEKLHKNNNQANKDNDYIIINHKTSKPITTIKTFWYTMTKNLGINNLKIHDLRHFFV